MRGSVVLGHALSARAQPRQLVAMAILRMNAQIDARHILPTIRVPTLVTHRVGDDAVPVEAGQFLARIVGEAEEFLTGSRTEVEIDRVLATVIFTDIVDSTKRAAELGDREWRAL